MKATEFILALRDHFFDKSFSQGTHFAADIRGHPDAWAVNHINVKRLQPIMEAFDDDASGLITITEINRFTSSPTRPQTWKCVGLLRIILNLYLMTVQITPLDCFLGRW